MKRILASAVAAFVVAGFASDEAQAQFPLTFSAGPTFSSISTDVEEFDNSSTTGFFAAAGTHFALTEAVSLSPYVGYVQKGSEDSSGKNSYDYIEIPVFLSVAVPLGETNNLTISAGPQFGFQINCDEPGSTEVNGDCSEFEDHKGTEFGFIGGVGLDFPFSDGKAFSVGGGFDFGLTDLFEDLDYKTQTYFIFVSISTGVGG